MKKQFILCILVIFAGLYNSCKNKSAETEEQISTGIINNPNSASADNTSSSVPVIAFEKEEHDFGNVIQGEKVSFSFKFKNTGNADLVISSVSTSCGCTVPQYPKQSIKPNEENYITVLFDSQGKKGFQNKSITIVANTQPSTKVLHIEAQITEP
ncbi:MAG: DUF1573 domain-containing protein [Lentimicrobiaceae bacterium]|nr:DUF1573 domain-containing protein [Lentimicrobiaceae bacterium]